MTKETPPKTDRNQAPNSKIMPSVYALAKPQAAKCRPVMASCILLARAGIIASSKITMPNV